MLTMLQILGEWATACAYAVVLVGMGLLTLMGGTVLLCLRLSWWLFCLPMNLGRKA